jgi:type VI secretion system secreted protein VgrG
MSEKAMSLQTADKFTLSCDKKGTLEFADELTIKVGKATLVLKKSGDIELNGKKLDIKMSGDVAIKGGKVKQN